MKKTINAFIATLCDPISFFSLIILLIYPVFYSIIQEFSNIWGIIADALSLLNYCLLLIALSIFSSVFLKTSSAVNAAKVQVQMIFVSVAMILNGIWHILYRDDIETFQTLMRMGISCLALYVGFSVSLSGILDVKKLSDFWGCITETYKDSSKSKWIISWSDVLTLLGLDLIVFTVGHYLSRVVDSLGAYLAEKIVITENTTVAELIFKFLGIFVGVFLVIFCSLMLITWFFLKMRKIRANNKAKQETLAESVENIEDSKSLDIQ